MATEPTNWLGGSRKYFSEVQSEYKKITWPPQKEAVAGTIGVVAVVTIVATALGVVDFILSIVMQLVVP